MESELKKFLGEFDSLSKDKLINKLEKFALTYADELEKYAFDASSLIEYCDDYDRLDIESDEDFRESVRNILDNLLIQAG